jgi:hypothetical protein
MKPPKELKELGDKFLAAGTMLEDALKHYTNAIANLEAIEAKGRAGTPPPGGVRLVTRTILGLSSMEPCF